MKDQEPLTQEAFQKALQLRDDIRGLLEGRMSYLQYKGLDPAIHLPSANWGLEEGLHGLYRTVLAGDYSVLNNLRLFTQIFTGFQLISQSGGEGLPLPGEVPPDLDERLLALVRRAGSRLPPEVKRYLETVRHLPRVLHITPPQTLGEVGWLVDGKIINHDTDAYLERILLLAECGILWKLRHRRPAKGSRLEGVERPLILEIGSGYGGLAYHLKKLLPRARYVLVDIPESLVMSSLYLSTLFPYEDNVLITPANIGDLRKETGGFTFVPNYLFDECTAAGLEFDLAINTLSMSEMSEKQVRYYCAGLAGLLGDKGVFFEQNRDTRFRGYLDARRFIADCLPFCLPLHSPFRQLHQGAAHLWAARPVPPFLWRNSREVGKSFVAPRGTWPPLLKRLGKFLLKA